MKAANLIVELDAAELAIRMCEAIAELRAAGLAAAETVERQAGDIRELRATPPVPYRIAGRGVRLVRYEGRVS